MQWNRRQSMLALLAAIQAGWGWLRGGPQDPSRNGAEPATGEPATAEPEPIDVRPASWDLIRRVRMRDGYRLFWNVGSWDPANAAGARRCGFEPVDLIDSFTDRTGGNPRRLLDHLSRNRTNPWNRPRYMEKIVRYNIQQRSNQGALVVHDLEFEFEQDVQRAWEDPRAREASGATSLEEFSRLYFRQWASWFYLPCKWTRRVRTGQRVGLYGVQPFRCDYWGLVGRDARQIDGSHAVDDQLWPAIDPYVGFYISSIYCFYDLPDSIFYMAANVEENWRRTRVYGDKPVYAYVSMRYHPSNPDLAGQELAPWLAEAMAVVPWFSGAKGMVLWGFEPDARGQPYRNLPGFMNSLDRVARVSHRLAKAELVIDQPAHQLWNARQPLIRKMRCSDSEWYVLGINPWQDEAAICTVPVECGGRTWNLELSGRRAAVFHLDPSVH